MNAVIWKTELYKICAKRVVWAAIAIFLGLFLLLEMQFHSMVGVEYTLEPVRTALTEAVQNEEFHTFVRTGGYNRSAEELRPWLPEEVFGYIEGYETGGRIRISLTSDLVRILNNYFERVDQRAGYLRQLAEDAAANDDTVLTRAKQRLLRLYADTPVNIELNLEKGANALIDVNHAAVFPGLIMLVILVGLSGVYADEYACGIQPALLTACRGRGGVFRAKLLASFVFVAGVVLLMEGFFLAVTAVCYHLPNGGISAASTYGLSLTGYGGSVYGFCARQAAGTLLAGFVLGSLVLFLSACSKNALIPFFAAGLYYGGTALYAKIVPLPPYRSAFWSLPGELSLFSLQTQVELAAPERITILCGVMLPTLAANLLFNLLLMLVCLLLCYRSYTRKQVRG